MFVFQDLAVSASADSTIRVWNVDMNTCNSTIKVCLSHMCVCMDNNMVCGGMFSMISVTFILWYR